jgi:hypothetical protein
MMARMARLGELLVRGAAITADQLQFALRWQKQHGGRLGTNLVELGFLSESALARTLSAQLGMPAASAGALEKVPAEVIRLLPPDSAAHYRAVPVRIEGGHLWMAMSDPSDQRAIADLDAVTKLTVRPMVAPDLLISYALERHYGVPHHRPSPRDGSAHLDLRIEVDGEATRTRPGGAPAPYEDPHEAAQRAVIQARVQELDERAPSFTATTPATVEPARAVPTPPRQQPALGRLGASALGARLVGAASQRDVFEAALAFLGQDFGRQLVMVHRNKRLAGFLASGRGVDVEALPALSVAVGEVPILAKVLADRRPRLGRASAQTLGPLSRVLGAPGDRAVLVLAVHCGGEPVGVLVATDGHEGVESFIDEYVSCGRKLDYALQMLVLRRRMMDA